jgi:hypothetical protein
MRVDLIWAAAALAVDQEERATAQDNSGQPAGARQQRPMAGSARHAEQISARLVELLLLRDAPVRVRKVEYD